MRKKFRFVLDLDVEIEEKIKGKVKGSISNLNMLLKEFLKDDRAILDLYKLWLLGDLQSDEHIEAIEQDIKTRDEKDILKSVLDKLPGKIQMYFIDVLNNNNNSRFEELESFFDQFSMLKFNKAGFIEVDVTHGP